MIIEQLEKTLRYKFRNSNILIQALTHTSHGGSEFQKLEFLGDRVLNLTLTTLLLEQEELQTEGQLAQAIAQLGSKDTLVQIAHKWQLNKFVQCNQKQIQSILADACEAVIGAIFIDAESNLDVVKALIAFFWHEYLQQTDYKDAKSALQELTYKLYKLMPAYNTEQTSGESHNPIFVSRVSVQGIHITCNGKGTSIKEAEKMAAKELLHNLKQSINDI